MIGTSEASGPFKGYLYQKLVALYLSVKFLIAKKEDDKSERYLVFEKFDDVALIKGVFNSESNDWEGVTEIHLFQTKYYKNDTLGEHRKAILQLYLNSKKYYNKYPGADIFIDFITKRKISHKTHEIDISSIISDLNVNKTTFYIHPNIPERTRSYKKFPEEFSGLAFPTTFNEEDFKLSSLSHQHVKAFTVLSYENINTFIKDNFDKINSDFSEPDNLVEKLYMRFTQEIFERKGMIRMDEVQDILQMPLTENINELISIGSDEWKQELIKDNLSRFIGEYFNAFDIIDGILPEITIHKDEMIDELNNSCNFLKKKIRRELVGSSYIKNMIKNVAMTDEEILISCLNDLINLGSKHFSEEKIKTWLKLHLLCCIRCENYSFEDKLIIVGASKYDLYSKRKDFLVMDFETNEKTIGCEDWERNTILVIDGDNDKEKKSQVTGKQIRVCCMKGSKNDDFNKFREEDKCDNPTCTARY